MRERVIKRSKNPSTDSFEITGEIFDKYLKYWQSPSKEGDIISSS